MGIYILYICVCVYACVSVVYICKRFDVKCTWDRYMEKLYLFSVVCSDQISNILYINLRQALVQYKEESSTSAAHSYASYFVDE